MEMRWWRAGSCRDFADGGDVDALGQVFEPRADREFDGAVDIVKIPEAVILKQRESATSVRS